MTIVEETKYCRRCEETKPRSEFHRNRKNADRLQTYCKLCCRALQVERIARNPEKVREANRAWERANPEKVRERHRRTRAKSLLKRRARKAVFRAVASGLLIRPEACSDCEAVGPVQAHHDDYSKPLEVRWLCSSCHGKTWRTVHAAYVGGTRQ